MVWGSAQLHWLAVMSQTPNVHFWEAAQRGDLARFRKWLPVVRKSEQFVKLLHRALSVAICNNHVALVQAMIECGAKANTGVFQQHPLWLAASYDCVATIAALRTAGTSVLCYHTRTGDSALEIACKKGHEVTVRLLLALEFPVTPRHLLSPLMHAAKFGHVGVCQALCAAKAMVNQRCDSYGDPTTTTILCVAANRRDCATAAVLLACKADADLGWPLVGAVINRDTAMARLLCEHKADVNGDVIKHPPLLCNAVASRQVAMTRVLLLARASPNAAGQHETPVLSMAAQTNHVALMRLLLSCRATVDATDKHGSAALHVAARARKANAARVLVEAKANVNLRDKDGWTPLRSVPDGWAPLVQTPQAGQAGQTITQVLLEAKAHP